MKIILVSERPEFLAVLEPMISSLPSVSLAATVGGSQAAGEVIALTRPDVVVLDVKRGTRALSQGDWVLAPDRPELIVIGADSAAACDAFDFDAAGFVQEPVALERLAIAFARASRRLPSPRLR